MIGPSRSSRELLYGYILMYSTLDGYPWFGTHIVNRESVEKFERIRRRVFYVCECHGS